MKYLWLAIILIIGSTLFCYELGLPIDRQIEVTGSFGEYRSVSRDLSVPEHFNMGIGISTGGRTGLDLYAPGDGFISDIILNDPLYGNAIIMTFPEITNIIANEKGLQVLYGHIESAGSMDSINTRKLKEIYQKLAKEYGETYARVVLDPREVTIKSGEIVGVSGDSGNVPPYLHLEVRDIENDNFLNPGLYFDLGNQQTTINISEISVNDTKYPLNPGEKPTIAIDEYSTIALHTGIKLRHNVSPKTIELYLDDSLVYQIDFTLIHISHKNEAADVYINSTNSDYWFKLRSESRTGVITVNRWNEIDMTYPHEAKIVVEDQWGNMASRNFILEAR